jgi:hypothetical protein
MDYLQELARAQKAKAKAKTTGREKPLPNVEGYAAIGKLPALPEGESLKGKMVFVVDLFPSPEPSAGGKSVLLTSFNKYITIQDVGLKTRIGYNAYVPKP